MPHATEGVLPSTSSSTKIAPVEVDLPLTDISLLATRAGEGQVERQDQLALGDEELGKISPLEELETAGSLGSEDVAVGHLVKNSRQLGSENPTSQGNRLPSLGISPRF